MKNKNHMKKFPPQLHLLFCLNSFRQIKGASEKKVLSFHRFKNVVKTALKFIKKNNSDYVPEENTSGDSVMLLYPHNIHSMSEISGIDKTPNLQKTTLQFYKSIISAYHMRARLEYDSDLAFLNHRITTL